MIQCAQLWFKIYTWNSSGPKHPARNNVQIYLHTFTSYLGKERNRVKSKYLLNE